MNEACFGRARGPFVTPQEFHERASSNYKSKGIEPYCPQCDEVVDLYGVNNWGISRFDHRDRPEGWNPLDDCFLSNRHDARFDGLKPDSWDYERGERLRRDFFENDNLRVAYAFALNMARKGNLPLGKWKSVIGRADRKKVWSYADIPLWVIPYILLTLENFEQKANESKGAYEFHFVFDKPKSTTASALWNPVVATSLKKIFTNSGQPVSATDNPFPISETLMREKAGNTTWITDGFLQMLKM